MGQSSPGRNLAVELGPDRPSRMLVAYLLNIARGVFAVRDLILDDIRRFSELGASSYVADLEQALDRFYDCVFIADAMMDRHCLSPKGEAVFFGSNLAGLSQKPETRSK